MVSSIIHPVTIYGQLEYMVSNNIHSVTIYDQ